MRVAETRRRLWQATQQETTSDALVLTSTIMAASTGTETAAGTTQVDSVAPSRESDDIPHSVVDSAGAERQGNGTDNVAPSRESDDKPHNVVDNVGAQQQCNGMMSGICNGHLSACSAKSRGGSTQAMFSTTCVSSRIAAFAPRRVRPQETSEEDSGEEDQCGICRYGFMEHDGELISTPHGLLCDFCFAEETRFQDEDSDET